MKIPSFEPLIILALVSCSKSSRTPSDSFPYLLTPDEEWIAYEGILPSEKGDPTLAELFLMPGSPGMDSYYKMHESLYLPGPPAVAMGTSSHGTYSVLIASPNDHIIHLSGASLVGSIMWGKKFSPSDRVTRDLFLRSHGDNELVLVDDDLSGIDPRYKLTRRSPLFTVEGYFTVSADTTEYFERNTRKNWAVSRLGQYDTAVARYHRLAREKFEGIYLKALSYSVRQTGQDGEERDVLVFKRVLKMDSTGGR